MLFSKETFSRDGLFLKCKYFREYRDGASTFLNVQHITIVIVGDGASTSPPMFLYEKNRINSLSPLGRVAAKPPREVLQPNDYRVSSFFTLITSIVLTSIFIPSIRFGGGRPLSSFVRFVHKCHSPQRGKQDYLIAFFVVFIASFRGFFVKKICCRSFCLYF